jgi:hypothetical protein
MDSRAFAAVTGVSMVSARSFHAGVEVDGVVVESAGADGGFSGFGSR